MESFNKTGNNKFYSKKPNNSINQKFILKRTSSCVENKNIFNYKMPEKNNNSEFLSSMDIEKEKFHHNNLGKTYGAFSSSSKILGNSSKLPLLSFNRTKKLSLRTKERIKNYEKMRKYRIKLKKTKKVDDTEDKLFKFLHENGLHYSFSSNKYIIGDKYEYYSKYLPDKFKINFNSVNIQRTKSNVSSKNQSHSNVPSENSKKKSKQNPKRNKKQGLFYSTTEEDDDDRMSYKKYMKLQSIADARFRPRLGDTSYDLINYIKKIDGIRKGVVNDLIKQINNVENRYNIEKPKEDSRFNTKMQGLYHHKWKNIFSLRDYQELFSKNLKGKISSRNYEIMAKNFRDIFLLCFGSGNVNISKIKPFQD